MAEPVKTWRYSVPSEGPYREGWAILFLDDAGCFAVLSDYGNYSHRWSVRGFAVGEDIRRFLLTCEDGYLMDKLCEREFSPQKSAQSIREAVLQCRRDGALDKDEAREEWDTARRIESGDLSFDAYLPDAHIGDAWELYAKDFPDSAKAFFSNAWPRIRALIAAEVEAERAPAAQEVAR